jgi:aspartyl-tRNA(Asn)/glutamyl-tRNA(Gln) amidotransferase subunit A
LWAAHAYEKATAWRQRRPTLDPRASFSTGLPPTPPPEPVNDPCTRDLVMGACSRAGLSLTEDQIAMICAAAPYVTAMTQRLRRERDFREEPANIFQFPH